MTYLSHMREQRLQPIRDEARITALEVVVEVLKGIEDDLNLTGTEAADNAVRYIARARERTEDALATAQDKTFECLVDVCPRMSTSAELKAHLYEVHTEGNEEDRRETVRRLLEQAGHRG